MSKETDYLKYKMMKCTACNRFISASACNFGCPYCGYTDGWDVKVPPLEGIKGIHDTLKEIKDDKERLRIDGSSNEKSQRVTSKSNKSDHELINRTLKEG